MIIVFLPLLLILVAIPVFIVSTVAGINFWVVYAGCSIAGYLLGTKIIKEGEKNKKGRL